MKLIYNSIINFFKALFSASGNVEEKNVVGFGAFTMMCIQAISNLFWGFKVDFGLFATFGTLVIACFGLNVVTTIKELTSKTTVASDMVKSDSTSQSNETAKDVLQSDKP